MIRSHVLDRPDGHRIHWLEDGPADGVPVLLLHGGPGSRQTPLLRAPFAGLKVRLIAPEQRGCGQSTPAGAVDGNDLDALLADLRALQAQLGLQRWWVAGGSWGATLALCHAADAPQACAGLLLRASFSGSAKDIAQSLWPSADHQAMPAPLHAQALAAHAAWLDAVAACPGAPQPHPPRDAGELLDALQALLCGPEWPPLSPALQAMLQGWSEWEQRLSGAPLGAAGAHPASPSAGAAPSQTSASDTAVLQRYRVHTHYLAHGCFLQQQPLAARLTRVPRVPTLLLHGADDWLCPPAGAQAIADALPGAQVRWLAGVGHDAAHPAMQAAARAAAIALVEQGHFGA